uniref:Rhomboid protein Hedne_RBL10 n=1 Tax=Hedera nepalensis TaxID=85358 RepID=A0A0A7E6R5_9APIA|nr:rhomboid protein Hedne_RBL10 [Hedera nepalensis]
MVGFSVPNRPSSSGFPLSTVGPSPFHLITTSAALRLGDVIRQRFIMHAHHLGLVLQSSIKNIFLFGHVPGLKGVWHGRTLQLEGLNFLQWPYDAWATTCSSGLFFFSGEGSRNNSGDRGKSKLDKSRKDPFSGRGLTNALFAINVLVYLAQLATQGKLMLWGAKINSLIDKGQLWRLVSSSFLHANMGHLMVNCYSLNSIGPTVEKISGPGRYMAVYIISAIASSAMSYWLCKAPAVGASGAIFGLVGSYAMFVLRHRNLNNDGIGDLQHIANVIVLNMGIGLMSKGIDNWGHLGGLLGGVATSWLIGPAWKYESHDQHRAFVDKAPIFSLIKTKRRP